MGDLAGEVAQLDASKIGDRDVGGAPGVAAQAVDLGLDGPQLFVGDDEKIAGAAGGIEDADAGEALAQVEQFAWVVAGLSEAGPQLVEEERVEYLQDIRHPGVVQAEGAALLVVGHGLNHGAEDVGIDFLPIKIAGVEQVRAGDLAEAGDAGSADVLVGLFRSADGDVGAPGAAEQAAVHVGKAVGPALDVGRLALGEPGIHRAEQLGEHQVGVGGIARAVICSIVPVKRRSPWKMAVSSAKKQKINRVMK